MHIFRGLSLSAVLVGFVVPLANVALAADAGSITIISPKDGAVLSSGSDNKLVYNVQLSPTGNHLHVYVDDQDEPVIARKVTGCPCSVSLPDMAPGTHKIVVKEATASHAMTGIQAAETVTVK